ncbi:putative C2H2 finger domain-containing protein [Rosellinia necatrix]|uniref:Putative C2H2 finger domain-containing protein n=1 Tax=Rosellinia necatrix TaxID=77044 RepID=A0A1W2TRP9_ROSNE|nr:putative C2H2 finger domain-containing protein [Rosellinia necatrix]
MDQPAAKKRRLAPKVEPQPSPSHPPQPPPPPTATSYAHEPTTQPSQHYQPQDILPPPPERHEFESFARHLQDAAMLIYRQSQRSPYNKVSVLLLRWDDDLAAELDLVALEHVLRNRYNYHTDRWVIPATANPSMKLGVRMASFLEPASPDHLLVVHYAGYSFVGSNKHLYWASNSKRDSAKLRWSGFRCLWEESQSDMLLLLDSGVVQEPTVKGASSTKQIIAAGTPDHYSRKPGAQSFTANLTEAFMQLGTGRPFTVEHLYQEAARLRQHELVQSPGLSNGMSGKVPSLHDKLPLLYAITSNKGQSLSLCPLTPTPGTQLQSPRATADAVSRLSREDSAIHPSAVADLTFDEPRVLVCTTFVGEASPDMSSFYHWLHNTPAIGSKIAVEGMFLGPPTMLLISMPSAVWNVVQHDKVCCFLGYVNSHNMTHLYNRLVGSMSTNKASPQEMEDGRMLLEAREVPTTTPARRHLLPETPVRPDGVRRIDPTSVAKSATAPGVPYPNTTPGTAATRKDDVEDSVEMQEAAEQLKALSHVSHVRHVSDDISSSAQLQPSPSIRATDLKIEERALNEVSVNHTDDIRYHAEAAAPSARAKPGRRSIQKPIPKQETRCGHCSHAPFKDSSSLRKHIAAAHTRPFPCAFSFAGCPSTFGSKNEWKRHIASQHLCLQYYRCSSCPQSSVEGKGNEFNRKDLFTQHLRRMHAPFAIKKALAKGDSKLQVEWETHVKEMQQSCLVTRRRPPQSSACPKPDCTSIFEGPTSWDEWTEHVGRHMEKGEADRLGVDRLLAKWALEEGIIERKEDGEYRLCSGNGSSAEKENNHSTEYHSDGNKRDPEERTIVAASTIVDKMDVD